MHDTNGPLPVAKQTIDSHDYVKTFNMWMFDHFTKSHF